MRVRLRGRFFYSHGKIWWENKLFQGFRIILWVRSLNSPIRWLLCTWMFIIQWFRWLLDGLEIERICDTAFGRRERIIGIITERILIWDSWGNGTFWFLRWCWVLTPLTITKKISIYIQIFHCSIDTFDSERWGNSYIFRRRGLLLYYNLLMLSYMIVIISIFILKFLLILIKFWLHYLLRACFITRTWYF